jgi:hypothetical protein
MMAQGVAQHQQCHAQHQGAHHQHVAQHGGHLRAHQVGDFVHKRLDGVAGAQSLSLAAMAGAVMAGCLVATVKCSNCTSTKLTA